MIVVFISIVIFIGVFCFFYALSGFSFDFWQKWKIKHVDTAPEKLEESFIFIDKKTLIFLSLSPFLVAALGFILTNNFWGALGGLVVGLMVPTFVIKMVKSKRIKKFRSQLVDTLMIFASSLKGGLSFLQCLEIICDEMEPPVSDEFGLILKQNRLGISLSDSLENLRKRVPLEEVNLVVSAVLVAKETGGNLPKVFSRLTGTIRSNMKIKQKIETLTLQGRLQGIIMSAIPFVFIWFIHQNDPTHFDIMFETNIGRIMLVVAVFLMILGLFLIKKFSTYKG